jgi:hypothetical protein
MMRNEMRNFKKILIGGSERKRHVLGADGGKTKVSNTMQGCELDSSGSGCGPGSRCYESFNETSGSMKGGISVPVELLCLLFSMQLTSAI